LLTRFLAVIAVGLTLLLGGAVASAQREARAPADLLDATAVPPLPDGFEELADGDVTWQFPSSARDLVTMVRDETAADRARVTRELGAPDGPVLIRVGHDPDEMRALAPPEAPPPAYAVGVTYPRLSLVLLTLAAPETWERPPVDRVLVHEWSHLALHRALGDAQAPLWLDEGLAIHEARERSFDRVRTLWEGTVRGSLIPLDDLSRRFPERPHAVDLAYAESADFVGWLFNHGEDGPARIPRLIERMRNGQAFDSAIRNTYGAGIGSLEVDWRGELGRRYAALPLLMGSSFAWLVVLVLLVLAYRRRRRDDARTLARWEAEEAREEAARLARTRAELDTMWREADAEADRATSDDAMPPPNARDDGIPRVVHDGREHTLH
jgi:hypothetical protein